MITHLKQCYLLEWEYEGKKVIVELKKEPLVMFIDANPPRIVCFEKKVGTAKILFYQMDGRLINQISPTQDIAVGPHEILYDDNFLYIAAVQYRRNKIINFLHHLLHSGVADWVGFRDCFYKTDFDGNIKDLLKTVPRKQSLKKSLEV